MKVRNTMNGAAIAAGYGLAVARAVERGKTELRTARDCKCVAASTFGISAADLRTLESAGLVVLGRVGRSILTFSLTDAGRTLAGKL